LKTIPSPESLTLGRRGGASAGRSGGSSGKARQEVGGAAGSLGAGCLAAAAVVCASTPGSGGVRRHPAAACVS
jgi:hypothetical protein